MSRGGVWPGLNMDGYLQTVALGSITFCFPFLGAFILYNMFLLFVVRSCFLSEGSWGFCFYKIVCHIYVKDSNI